MNGINSFYSRFVKNVDLKAIYQVLSNSNNKVKTAAGPVIGSFALWYSSKQSHCAGFWPFALPSNPLLERARIDARENPVEFCESMKSNMAFNEGERIELAKIVMDAKPEEALRLIDNFRIQDKEALIEVAHLGAEQSAKQRIELAMSDLLENFLNRIKELAKTPGEGQARAQRLLETIETNPDFLSSMVKYLKEEILEIQLVNLPLLHPSSFRKLDLAAQEELGKIVATRYPIHLPRFIFNSNLHSPAQEELIKMAAAQKNEKVSLSIFLYNADSFPATNKKDSDSIDITSLLNNAQGHIGNKSQAGINRTAPHIFVVTQLVLGIPYIVIQELYGKDNLARISEESRLEIAKIAVSQKGNSVSTCIRNYRIKDQKQLLEIADTALSTDPEGLISNIDKYGIEDLEALAELAKKAARKHGKIVIEHLGNFGITAEKDIEEIKKIASKSS